jgi:RNA recognition motif-containing protein
VVECTLKKDYYAYVLYTNARGAQNAFKNANGLRMLGRKLTVHLATSKKSQSHLNHPNMLNTTTTQQQQTNISDTNTNANETATTGLSSSSSSSPPPPPQTSLQTNSNDSQSTTNVTTAKIVHVRNFPETCSQQQIRECFNSYGEIVECLILHDSYAFVHFKMASDARLALQSTNNTQFMGQNLLVQYSRSKFKQQNGTTTINNAMAPPLPPLPPQLMSTNLDENNSGSYFNTNNNGFKRNTNTNSNTYSNYVEQQQTNMGCINDSMPPSSSNIINNRNNVNKMTTLKYQQVNNVTSQSKPLPPATSGGGARSLSIENATNRNKQNVNLIKKASGGGATTTQITTNSNNNNNNTTTRNYKVALGLNLASNNNNNGQNQKNGTLKSNENSNGDFFNLI